MVSLKPPEMREVTIQACSIMGGGITPAKEGHPGLFVTDCDSTPGNSAALVLSFETAANGDVKTVEPVGISKGSFEKVGDYQSWDLKTNSNIGILLDGSFNSNLVSK